MKHPQSKLARMTLANPDPSLCPLCGKQNACAIQVQNETGLLQPPCWCLGVAIDPAILQRIPNTARAKACICASCASLQKTDISRIVTEIAEKMRLREHRGTVASYIPRLASVSPHHFGIAVVLADGTMHCAGDAMLPFSIQSVSKVFTLTLALQTHGDALWRRVGREPSGSSFNSVVQLENECGIPRNPFINAGAIVVSDIVLGEVPTQQSIDELLSFVRILAGDPHIEIDLEVAHSEAATGFRNIALANYMKSFGNMSARVDDALTLYFHQCALTLSCRQLALAGRYLMHEGRAPHTGEQIISPMLARRINALMLTCGHYDASGEIAFRVGIPGKSGVGGGILAIVPGRASIAVWSPGLNQRGNSQLGTEALELLADATGWSVFMAA